MQEKSRASFTSGFKHDCGLLSVYDKHYYLEISADHKNSEPANKIWTAATVTCKWDTALGRRERSMHGSWTQVHFLGLTRHCNYWCKESWQDLGDVQFILMLTKSTKINTNNWGQTKYSSFCGFQLKLLSRDEAFFNGWVVNGLCACIAMFSLEDIGFRCSSSPSTAYSSNVIVPLHFYSSSFTLMMVKSETVFFQADKQGAVCYVAQCPAFQNHKSKSIFYFFVLE